ATTAAKTITEADVRRRVFLIADDSMGGRDTPSRGLDLTAQYVASEFKRFGLKPAGDAGGFFQRYRIRLPEVDAGRSSMTFSSQDGAKIELGYGPDLKSSFGAPKNPSTDTPIALLGGPIELDSKFDVRALEGHALIWIATPKGRPNFVAVVSL